MNKQNIEKFVKDGMLMNLIIPINELECEFLEDHLSNNVVNLRGLSNESVYVVPL